MMTCHAESSSTTADNNIVKVFRNEVFDAGETIRMPVYTISSHIEELEVESNHLSDIEMRKVKE